MVRLTRSIRFAINPKGLSDAVGPNRSAASPPMRGLGAYYELHATCVGTPTKDTGYLINIKDIDRACRAAALPIITHAYHTAPTTPPHQLLPALFTAVASALPIPGVTLASLRWSLTPQHTLEIQGHDMAHAILRQRFEFAAAHRLHAPTLSDEQNRATFGKCNNPSGHGHNYIVEPAVTLPLDPGATPFTIDTLEALVEDTIIEPFDHKHLNKDTPEFDPTTGANPSVENMARVFYELLAPKIAATNTGATLKAFTVWETDRTSCTYPEA